MTSMDEVLAPHIVRAEGGSGVDWTRLKADLVAREDGMADVLRLAGVQFGLFPEIVAEVLAEVQMGSPVSPEERTMVRQQFITLMERLREEHEGNH